MLRRDADGRDDIVVHADATSRVADLVTAIAPAGEGLALAVTRADGTRTVLDAEQTLADAVLGSGEEIAVAPAPPAGARSDAPVVLGTLRVEAPDGTVTERPLTAGRWIVGRDPACDIVLDDGMVSQRHARLEAGDDLELVDLNSANGLLVDGGLVPRVRLGGGQSVVLGATRLSVHRLAGGTRRESARGGSEPFARSPRVLQRYGHRELPAPELPSDRPTEPFPWISLLAPTLMGLVVFIATGQLISLLFLALTPLMLVGSFVDGRLRQRRERRAAIERFTARLDELGQQLESERPMERRVRLAEAPSAAELLTAPRERSELLWSRRPEHENFLTVRLATGRARARTSIAAAAVPADAVPGPEQLLAALRERFRSIDDVPLIENPASAGAIGLAGPIAETLPVLNALLVQFTALHAPPELAVACVSPPALSERLDWLKWLPHTSHPRSPLHGVHLADSEATCSALLSELEGIVSRRAGGDAPAWRTAQPAADATTAASGRAGLDREAELPPAAAQLPAIVLVVVDDAPVPRSRLVQLAERAAGAGVAVLWVAADRRGLPAVCRTFLELAPDGGEVGLVRSAERLPATVERVPEAQALEFARALAPLVDAGAPSSDASDLPATVSTLALLGPELAEDPEAIVDRWRQTGSIVRELRAPARAGSLRTLVGQGPEAALHLDLRSQGPHALVGGTTGSGKSEFLQAWVLGMAAEYSPDRVTFLFVDYKGGSAFAECVNLPHCVGIVTDLTPHLVHRALTSLRAELRHREHLLAELGAKDLLELERRAEVAAPPALVIVIDEFAALATEVPEFIDGVVDIAQRGRSLGIHLIMATQRPAGVIRDNLRANTNLRVALRMADEADSTDVIGSALAAGFDPAVPGRAAVRVGPGRVHLFQSGYVGGWTGGATDGAEVRIADLRFGTETPWPTPERAAQSAGEPDGARLVASIGRAAAQLALTTPRRPWLPELPAVVALPDPDPADPDVLVFGLVDDPARQRQLPLVFRPDLDGGLAIVGAGGSGCSTALRTIACAAEVALGAPIECHVIDGGAGNLRMLEELPGVGSVIAVEDTERVERLMRLLASELATRADAFAETNAATLVDYRRLSGTPLPRVLLLLDGIGPFRETYDTGARSPFATLQRLVLEGRQLGVHVVVAADRWAQVPTALTPGIPRRIALRQSDDNQYLLFDAPRDMIGPDSPPGRGVLDGREVQLAAPGGAAGVPEQALWIAELGRRRRDEGRVDVAPIRSLPATVEQEELPAAIDTLPVLGIAGDTLEPMAFDPAGTFLVAGGPGSGRTTALRALVAAIRRADPASAAFFMGDRRSPLASDAWEFAALDLDAAAELARKLTERMLADAPSQRLVVVIESVGEIAGTSAENAIVALAKAARRSGHTVIGEAETTAWASPWPVLSEFKSARRGLVLQPEALDGDSVLRTTFPRVRRSEFPPGRALVVLDGTVRRVQLPQPRTGTTPSKKE